MFYKIKRAIALSVLTASFIVSSTGGAAMPAISAGPGQPAPNNSPNTQSKVLNTNGTGSNSPILYYNWSGYAATGGNPYLAVTATFVQPKVTCTVPGAWTLFWVGFDGFNNNTVEQAGTAAQCSTGSNPQPTYYAWWEMYPTNGIAVMPLTIKPGDSILAKASYNPAKATYSLNVADKTTAQHYTKVASCEAGLTCARQSAEWIVERTMLGSNYAPLANWNTMQIKTAKASNSYSAAHPTQPLMQPISAFNNTPINMVDYPYTGKVLATVGPLNSTGTAFTDTWLAAQ